MSEPADPARVERVAAALSAAPKYRHLHPDLLLRAAARAAALHPRDADAQKAAKGRLHQAFGAFFDPRALCRVEEWLGAGEWQGDEAARRRLCRRVLALHASSAERLPHLDGLAGVLAALAPPPSTVLDVACGLMPFALPWLGLGPAARYVAVDVDRRMVAVAAAFLAAVDPRHAAVCSDVVAAPPAEEVDLALLWKTAPTLEREQPGAVLRLLGALKAARAILSFPTRTLGGRDKGMAQTYRRDAERIAAALAVPVRFAEHGGELFAALELCGRRRSADL